MKTVARWSVRKNRHHHSQSRGRYLMQRGWQDHPAFPAEPFTAREAWEWMIAEAFWREGRTRIGQFVVTLTRGQLCASVRHLASCWQWTPSKVERFLKRLKTETMVETRSETGINVITICNYNKFQTLADGGETVIGTLDAAVPRQQRDKKEKHHIGYTKEDSEESFSLFPAQTAPPVPRTKAADPPYSLEFEAFWSAYPRHNGSKKEAFKIYQQKIKKGVAHGTIHSGAEKYRTAHEAKGGGTAYVKHAHRWLANECWDNDYTIDAGASGNSASIQSETGRFVDHARSIIEERTERANRLARTTNP